ncbi:MAG: hypothetical protein R6X02_31655 [Enhygromyxa sp.]
MSVVWRQRATAVLTSAVLLGATACTHAPDRAEGYGTRAPRKQPDVSKVPVDGAWVRIRFDGGDRLVGELLVAEPDGVVIVRTRKHGDQTRDTATIRRASVRTDPAIGAWLGGLGGGTGAMIVVSLATGWYVMIFAPIVVAAGGIAMGIAYAESRVVLRDDKLHYLHQYARWPQGRPQTSPTLDASPDPAPDPSPGEWPAEPLTAAPPTDEPPANETPANETPTDDIGSDQPTEHEVDAAGDE